MDHLRSGVQDQPDQHGETPSFKKKKERKKMEGGREKKEMGTVANRDQKYSALSHHSVVSTSSVEGEQKGSARGRGPGPCRGQCPGPDCSWPITCLAATAFTCVSWPQDSWSGVGATHRTPGCPELTGPLHSPHLCSAHILRVSNRSHELLLFFLFSFFFLETEFRSCYPGWSAMA